MRDHFDRPVDRRFSHSKKWHQYRGEDIISLALDDSDFCIPEVVETALVRRLSHSVLGHTQAPEPLRQLIANRLEHHFSWVIEPEWIHFVPGDRCGLSLAIAATSQPGKKTLAPQILDPALADAIEHAGATYQPYRLSLQKTAQDYYLRWLPEWLPLNKQASGASALIVSNPNYPTGTLYRREELACFLEIAEQQKLWLISDESFCDLHFDDKPHVPLASLSDEAQDRVITLMSPAKSFSLCGVQCGFVVIKNKQLQQRFQRAGQAVLADGLNAFAYTAMSAAYRGGDPWLAAQRDYLQGNRELLEYQINHIAGLSLHRVEGGYMAWIDASGLGKTDIVSFFQGNGVAVLDGKGYGMPGYILLNFACSRSLLQLAMRRMARAVTGRG